MLLFENTLKVFSLFFTESIGSMCHIVHDRYINVSEKIVKDYLYLSMSLLNTLNSVTAG